MEALSPGLVARVIAHPPRVIVTERGGLPPLLALFPEFHSLSSDFRPVRAFGAILILLRNDLALPAGAEG